MPNNFWAVYSSCTIWNVRHQWRQGASFGGGGGWMWSSSGTHYHSHASEHVGHGDFTNRNQHFCSQRQTCLVPFCSCDAPFKFAAGSVPWSATFQYWSMDTHFTHPPSCKPHCISQWQIHHASEFSHLLRTSRPKENCQKWQSPHTSKYRCSPCEGQLDFWCCGRDFCVT